MKESKLYYVQESRHPLAEMISFYRVNSPGDRIVWNTEKQEPVDLSVDRYTCPVERIRSIGNDEYIAFDPKLIDMAFRSDRGRAVIAAERAVASVEAHRLYITEMELDRPRWIEEGTRVAEEAFNKQPIWRRLLLAVVGLHSDQGYNMG